MSPMPCWCGFPGGPVRMSGRNPIRQRKLKLWRAGGGLLRRLAFNVVARNHDDLTKNFSFQRLLFRPEIVRVLPRRLLR